MRVHCGVTFLLPFNEATVFQSKSSNKSPTFEILLDLRTQVLSENSPKCTKVSCLLKDDPLTDIFFITVTLIPVLEKTPNLCSSYSLCYR